MAADHAYIIYNRRFHEIQIITVYAVVVDPETADIQLNPVEHSEYQWVSYETALDRVHYRGPKYGTRSVNEYVTGVAHPAPELRFTLTALLRLIGMFEPPQRRAA